MTVGDIIISALRICGAVAKSEVPTSDEMQDALAALNMMLDNWSARNLMKMSTVTESLVLTAGKGSYTIGSGGEWNTTKPYAVRNAFLRDGNGMDEEIILMTRDQYNALEDKATPGRPQALLYDPGDTQQTSPLGTVFLYYVPDASTTYTLFITSDKALTEFAATTTVVTFDAAYREAIKYNLAIRLWREYNEIGKPIPPDIVALAKESLQTLETLNARQVISRIEIPGTKGVFNIYTGDYPGGS